MSKGLIAKQAIKIDAPMTRVWDAFVNPDVIKQYMFGTTAISDWKTGSPIVWTGEWQGKTYRDHGVIRRLEPNKVIEYTYFSSMSGLPDRPENYCVVTVEFAHDAAGVIVSLTQDNNPTEQAREHSEKNWAIVLEGVKKLVET